jgi:DsbE subfamily thiol:disulfide oxidoreductase
MGMSLAHFGLGVFLLGVTVAKSFSVEQDAPLQSGQSAHAGAYEFVFQGVQPRKGPNYTAMRGTIEVRRNGEMVTILHPEKRTYLVQRNPMTESDIDARLSRDLYVALGEDVGANAWSVRVQYKPLVRLTMRADHGPRRSRRRLGQALSTLRRIAPEAAFARAGGPVLRFPRTGKCLRRAAGIPLCRPLIASGGSVLSSASRARTQRGSLHGKQAYSRHACAGKRVLNVWGTWCVACREEHQALLEIARTKAVPIYGLDWKDDRASALAWLQQLGNPYDAVGFDSEGRVAIDWGVYGAPETFLVDARGMVVCKQIGPMDMEIWRKKFLPLINGAKGPCS